jgi:hypothetical protein
MVLAMDEAVNLDRPIGSAAELRDRLAQVFPGEVITLPPHLDAVLALHAPLGDQLPATCGAYVLSYLLPARGHRELDGQSLAAEDYMAHLAEVTIETREDAASYGYPMRSSDNRAEVGTSAEGVARAISLATGGRLATVPIPGRSAGGRPQLETGAWEALLGLVEDDFAGGRLDILFNYESDQLLGARDPAYTAANLRRPDAAAVIPRDSWGVGHFVPLIGHWRRPAGDRWLVILNSFKARAFSGAEPQPAELMRRGVVREDGRGGGVLLVVPAESAGHWVDRVEALGLEVGTWSNGSREPAGWRWARGR